MAPTQLAPNHGSLHSFQAKRKTQHSWNLISYSLHPHQPDPKIHFNHCKNANSRSALGNFVLQATLSDITLSRDKQLSAAYE